MSGGPRNQREDMTRQAEIRWTHAIDAVLGVALTLSIAIGGYYVNQMDQRDKRQDELLQDHAWRITKNEKEIEFATRKFIDIDNKLDEVLKEVRSLRERP